MVVQIELMNEVRYVLYKGTFKSLSTLPLPLLTPINAQYNHHKIATVPVLLQCPVRTDFLVIVAGKLL